MGPALDQFKASLELAKALKKLEKDNYPPTPRIDQQPAVKGLRGGSAVLMVASFEFFLRRLFEENISKLNTIPVTIEFDKLPDKLKVKAVFDGLQRAMDGPLFEAKPNKVDRIKAILEMCKLLINENINPLTFGEIGSNPNGNTVKEKFKEVGISDIFLMIKAEFEKRWGSAVSDTFIKDKLDEIVGKRHVVAHTADTLNITRQFQNEALKFLKILAELLDKELDKHIKHLLRTCKRP